MESFSFECRHCCYLYTGQPNATIDSEQVDGMTVSVTLDLEFDAALTDPNSEQYQNASTAVILAFIRVIIFL